MNENDLRNRLSAYDAIILLRGDPGPCGCMGPQGDDPLCPCLMSAATQKTLKSERDMTLIALARITGAESPLQEDSADG